MTTANDNKPTLRSLALSLEHALGDNEDIDAQLCRFFSWAGAKHGQADLHQPFHVSASGVAGSLITFTRRDGPFLATVPLPNITGSIEEVAALVRAFAPHMEWGLVGYSATSDEQPLAFIAPNAESPDLGTGAVTNYGATHAIALLRALLHILGRDGFEVAAWHEIGE